MSDSCPFCHPDPARMFHHGCLILGIWDAFPVARGHALLITRRHVSTWFEATIEEQHELIEALEIAKQAIECSYLPAGYNIGVNVNLAAGQTVPHLHVHLIPRLHGDVNDPTGGVRNVIPQRGNYLLKHAFHSAAPSRLVKGRSDPLLPHLLSDLDRARNVDLAVAFVLESGVRLIREHLRDRLQRGGRIRLLTGDYLDITSPDALSQLLDLRCDKGELQLKVFETEGLSFHPKAYIFLQDDRTGYAYIGSSNLTESALRSGVEWNLRIDSQANPVGFSTIVNAFEDLFADAKAKPVDDDWIEAYRKRRGPPESRAEVVEVRPEPPEPPPKPNAIQEEALTALQKTRSAGHTAGLVVLATGLGKTWLSAFDSDRPDFRRILFVAHREEILSQARDTFRRIRPKDRLGFFTGNQKDAAADVLFASIQTIARTQHLSRYSPPDFDYIVVDEFHHAAARTYRKLLAHFKPKFILGLTATPDRTDRADLLALCQENLVYQCDFLRGIRRDLLCPFDYFGVPDEVDYTNIPWRSSRFDEEELTRAVATAKRAENVLEQFHARAGRRTLGFCCSQRHADFMANYFQSKGIKAAAVHSGPNSAPRASSLEKLRAGELQVLFAVDMFNEGVDLPNVDTVMMLRPTESSIVWTQQMGRGLRKAKGKDKLRVIDYIGNHRIFLEKIRALFEPILGHLRSDLELSTAMRLLRESDLGLPPGCEITYDLVAIDIINTLLRKRKSQDLLVDAYRDFKTRNGSRPTAAQMLHEGFAPKAVHPSHGSWLNFVRSMGDLSESQVELLDRHSHFLTHLEKTQMTKSYKMLVLLAMLNQDLFPGEISLDSLRDHFRELAHRSGFLRADIGSALNNDTSLARLIVENPVQAWTGGKGTGARQYFEFESGVFRTLLRVDPADREEFQEMARELVDWRIAEYVTRTRFNTEAISDFVCKVSHASGRPMLFLPDREKSPNLPAGTVSIVANGEELDADFVKVALNVVSRPGSKSNILPEILRGWFGEKAGLPGTNFHVSLRQEGLHMVMRPIGRPARSQG